MSKFRTRTEARSTRMDLARLTNLFRPEPSPPPSRDGLLAHVAFAMQKRSDVNRAHGESVVTTLLRREEDLVVTFKDGSKAILMFDLHGPIYNPADPLVSLTARDVWPYTVLGATFRERFPDTPFCLILVTDSEVPHDLSSTATSSCGLYVVDHASPDAHETIREINICINRWQGATP